MKKLYSLLFFTPLFFFIKTPLAWANCADRIASLDLVQPAMERHFAQLQQETNFSWGNKQPFGQIDGNQIILTPAFDSLNGTEKQQVLDRLNLGYNNNWFNLLSPEEQDAALQNSGIGAMSPYEVYASDGRAVAMPYDGCTRTISLTEKDRFSWYFNRPPQQENSVVTPEALRNAGQPFWRQVRFPISPQQEKNTRLRFWNTVGYERAKQGWWIAWVPEQGYFEINVPANYEQQHLQRFWRVAPGQYRYVILRNDGTFLEARN